MRNPKFQLLLLLFCLTLTSITSISLQASVTYAKQLQGQKVDDGNILTWSTLTETNSDFFIVERSYDGFKFEQVMKIEAAGNSDDIKSYRFTDLNEKEGRVFYRLQQVDYDGQVFPSHIVIVEKVDENRRFQVQMLSSISTDRYLTMVLNAKISDQMQYRVMTRLGEVAMEGKTKLAEGVNAVAIDMKDLSVGTYQLAIKLKNEIEVLNIKKTDSKELLPEELATKHNSSGKN